MHGWRHNVELLEMVDRPQTLGFQADMAHTMLFTIGYNAPEDRLLPENFDWSGPGLTEAYRKMADALRPWTFDFHVAQNDGSVKGSGSHDKTGRRPEPISNRTSRQRLECVQLAAAVDTPAASESGSKLRALQTLRVVAGPRVTTALGKEAPNA